MLRRSFMTASAFLVGLLPATGGGPPGAAAKPFAVSVTAATSPPGWAGADLKAAQAEASHSGRPVLVFARSSGCLRCDRVEGWLTSDPEIVPLTEPFIRLRIETSEPEGVVAAALLDIDTTPAVVILGPEGMEATRGEGRITRSWLLEKLIVLALRHGPPTGSEPPDPADLAASRERLLGWGDTHGAEQLAQMLGGRTGVAVSDTVSPGPAEALSETEIRDRLAAIDDPAQMRQRAHELATSLEQAGRPGLALAAYHEVVALLEQDPLSEARAGFLAARHRLALEPTRRRLMEAREATPDSVPLLMALARAAEQSDRLYQAFHAAEAAAAYSPGDAWVQMEHRRLRLLVRLSNRKTERDPA